MKGPEGAAGEMEQQATIHYGCDCEKGDDSCLPHLIGFKTDKVPSADCVFKGAFDKLTFLTAYAWCIFNTV